MISKASVRRNALMNLCPRVPVRALFFRLTPTDLCAFVAGVCLYIVNRCGRVVSNRHNVNSARVIQCPDAVEHTDCVRKLL